jgi:hypothetical protein
MVLKEKVMNNKVVDIIEIYKFCFRHISTGVVWTIQILNFKIWQLWTEF